MARIDEVRERYESITEQLYQNKETFAEYLKFAGRFFKMPTAPNRFRRRGTVDLGGINKTARRFAAASCSPDGFGRLSDSCRGKTLASRTNGRLGGGSGIYPKTYRPADYGACACRKPPARKSESG